MDPYASGILKREVHARLVADLDNIARDAAIQPKWIWTPLEQTVSPAEVEWVKRFRYHPHEGRAGLCLTGKSPEGVEDRMCAIAGALVRNFIRARVYTVGQLIELLADGEPAPTSTCLLIPNFFLGKALGASLVDWKVTLLFDALLDRHLRGLQTVLYASDLKAMAVEYGAAIAQHVKSNYQLTSISGGVS